MSIFRKLTSPAFQPGEVWVDRNNGGMVIIVELNALYEEALDVDGCMITYEWLDANGYIHRKEASWWNFQSQHTHIADN